MESWTAILAAMIEKKMEEKNLLSLMFSLQTHCFHSTQEVTYDQLVTYANFTLISFCHMSIKEQTK